MLKAFTTKEKKSFYYIQQYIAHNYSTVYATVMELCADGCPEAVLGGCFSSKERVTN